MLEQLEMQEVQALPQRAEEWLKLLGDHGCLQGVQIVAPVGRRLEIVFGSEHVGPLNHDHGLTKATVDGLYLRKEHLDTVAFFRLDEISSICFLRER